MTSLPPSSSAQLQTAATMVHPLPSRPPPTLAAIPRYRYDGRSETDRYRPASRSRQRGRPGPRSSIRADTWRPGDGIGSRGWRGDEGRSGRYGAGYREVSYESWRGVSERRYERERMRSWQRSDFYRPGERSELGSRSYVSLLRERSRSASRSASRGGYEERRREGRGYGKKRDRSRSRDDGRGERVYDRARRSVYRSCERSRSRSRGEKRFKRSHEPRDPGLDWERERDTRSRSRHPVEDTLGSVSRSNSKSRDHSRTASPVSEPRGRDELKNGQYSSSLLVQVKLNSV